MMDEIRFRFKYDDHSFKLRLVVPGLGLIMLEFVVFNILFHSFLMLHPEVLAIIWMGSAALLYYGLRRKMRRNGEGIIRENEMYLKLEGKEYKLLDLDIEKYSTDGVNADSVHLKIGNGKTIDISQGAGESQELDELGELLIFLLRKSGKL